MKQSYGRWLSGLVLSAAVVACGGGDFDAAPIDDHGVGGAEPTGAGGGAAVTSGGAGGDNSATAQVGVGTTGSGGTSPIPTPEPWDGSKVDVIGYYGNSGNAVSAIPLLTAVPCQYNVIILTFANLQDDGSIIFELQGPYENDLASLKADIKTWKQGSDPYGRERKVLFSIGGQNGHWPDGLTVSQVKTSIDGFIAEYDLDGLDVDLEGAAVENANTLVDVVADLRTQGFVVTAAPEAAQGPLSAYDSLLPYLDWVHPQFYNNGPNAVTTPYSPALNGDAWVAPPNHWQDATPAAYDGAGQAYWVSVLETLSTHLNLADSQQGMLIPATTSAAGNNNDWDIDLLKTQIENSKVRHVGTWAIAYDNEIDYKFAKTMAAIMDPTVTCPSQ